ncbi:MAG: hypothetical protein WAK67_18910 [Xanthobacteraceae bacterium]
MDRAELDALGLALGRTQLAAWINLDFDATSRIFLNGARIVLGKLMQSVIQGRQRYLHDIGFVVGGVRAGSRR